LPKFIPIKAAIVSPMLRNAIDADAINGSRKATTSILANNK
jgi:hypothetical protein